VPRKNYRRGNEVESFLRPEPEQESRSNSSKISKSKGLRRLAGGLQRSYTMKPQRQLQGQPRKIVGFHLDENLDWVAVLECGHQQLVRHNPPWTERHWVTTAEGREAHIGQELQCLACKRID